MMTGPEFPDSLVERVVDLLSTELDIPRSELSPDAHLVRDLGIDSLDVIAVILAVEERFGITFPDEGARGIFLERVVTVQDLANAVEACWGTGQPDRPDYRPPRGDVAPADEEPFSQLGGVAASAHDRLYHPIESNREGYPQFRRATDGMRCALLPEAEGWIGTNEPGALTDQGPPHRVQISSFLMDAEPVSNMAYARFLNSVGPVPQETLRLWCGPDANDDRGAQFGLVRLSRSWEPVPAAARQPMILVSWFGAHAYARWAHEMDWRSAADSPCFLPSEAQWEYAARGPEAVRAIYASTPNEKTERTPLFGLHRRGRAYRADALPAASVSARIGMSPFGLHHMGGNVWQWCRDWYASDFNGRPDSKANDACNTAPTGIRSERGGSWVGPQPLTQPTYRRGRPPQAKGRCLGFRCAASAGLVQCK